jgi:transcriptional regulator with XRE-family HTH domain
MRREVNTVESRTEQAIYDKMRDYVIRNDLSQRIIALNMGITESQVSLLLNGKRRLTVEDYLSFCRAISVSPTKFLPTTA